MKKLLLFALLLATVAVYAQNNYKFYAQGLKMIGPGEDWEAQEWKPSGNMLISITFYDDSYEEGRLRIYSKKTQQYTLIYAIDVPDDSKYTTTKWQAEDDDGLLCTVRVLNWKDPDYHDILVIAYDDYQWAYTITAERQ